MGRLVGILATIVVLVSACGGSDDPASSTTDVDATPDESVSEEPVAETTPVDAGVGVVAEIEVTSADHVEGEVDYAVTPPVGGDHFPGWQNCGFYDTAIIDEVAVHSLEHGAVWIAFDPSLDSAVIQQISDTVAAGSHRLAAPYPGLDEPIVLSAWGRQLRVESFDDPAVATFIDEYEGRKSPTAPEAGAACTGAIGAPPDNPTAGMPS